MEPTMGGAPVPKGSKTDLIDSRYTVRIEVDHPAGAVDVAAVLVTAEGKVRSDNDFVFFNNPTASGVRLESDAVVSVDLAALPADIHRVIISGSTEAQELRFGEVSGLRVTVAGESQRLAFVPPGLDAETVLQAVALYRRGSGWRLDAIGQGYSAGLAAFATDHGIVVDEEPEVQAVAPQGKPPQPPVPPPAVSPIDLRKVDVVLTKDSPDKRARIDLRKGDPGCVLTVGLEWDGRGARYDQYGNVVAFGEGDLDVYFFCRNEVTGDFVVISGERGRQGDLNQWPFIHHRGDSLGPGAGNRPAVEQVLVRPTENGDLLLNVYQSVDNGPRSGPPSPISTCATASSPSTAPSATAAPSVSACRCSTPRASGCVRPRPARWGAARRETGRG